MRMISRKIWKRMLAIILSITMFVTSVSLETLAAEKDEEVSVQETKSKTVLDETNLIGGYAVDRDDVINTEKTESSTTYDAGNGVKVTEFYSQPVRFKDENGELVDYDASLMKVENEKTKNGRKLENYKYENTAGDKKQYFPEELNEETPIIMEYKDYQISFAPSELKMTEETLRSLDTSQEVISEGVVFEEAETEVVLKNESVEITEQSSEETIISETAELQEPQTDEFTIMSAGRRIRLEENQAKPEEPIKVNAEKITNLYGEKRARTTKAIYPSEDKKISFEYTSTETGVKEEIILKEKPTEHVFTMTLEIPGLIIRENVMDKGLTLYDAKEKKIVAGIQAPYMNDATGEAYSEELYYEVIPIDEEVGEYLLTLVVDEEYLQDGERKYPVTIDPTLTWNDDLYLSDVYVLSGSDYNTYNFYDSGTTAFHLGSLTQGLSRDYIYFEEIYEIDGRYVESASLTLTSCTNSESGQTIQAYRVTSAWDLFTISWNTRPSNASTVLSSFTTTAYGVKKYTLDLTTLMRNYANGSWNNYGIMLKNSNESTGFAKFYGTRHSTASYRPKLTVVHYDPPTQATAVTVTPEYIKPGGTVTASWNGITSKALDYIQYKIIKCNPETEAETGVAVAYSSNTKIGTTATGSAEITGVSTLSDGKYKIAVRGVDKGGTAGAEQKAVFVVDNTPPTGAIRVMQLGYSTETSVLQNTVQIVGEVDDGYGSGIKTSDMKLYDSEGNFVQDIYTNSTLSKTIAFDATTLTNGTYVLKLSMEDNVGNTAEVSKTVTVSNVLPALTVPTIMSCSEWAVVRWELPSTNLLMKQIAYKAGNNIWTSSWGYTNVSGTSGTFAIQLQGGDGAYKIYLRGVDSDGNQGREKVVDCILDRVKPTSTINSFERGMLYGTVSDTYFDRWYVTLKKEGETTEEIIFSGNTAITNTFIGTINTEELDGGANYEVTLYAVDQAGNKTAAVETIVGESDEQAASTINTTFAIKRPNYDAHTNSLIVFPSNTTQLELTTFSDTVTMPEGTVRWYCDNQLVSSEDTWTLGIWDKSDEKTYSVLTLITDEDGNNYYSRNRIQNKGILEFSSGTALTLPEGCVSFRLNTGNSTQEAMVSVDGNTAVSITSGETYYVAQLTNYAQVTASTITVTVSDTSIDTSEWTLETDCALLENITFSEIENYHPYSVTVQDKLNYKTYVKWSGIQGTWPENVTYEIYRGLEEDFTPSEENLIAKNLTSNYCAEINVNYSGTFYYKIRAVEKNASGTIIKASSFSEEVASTVIDADEYVKRMGLKEYWEYAEFATPSGNGYIEKSKGNLVYIQADAEIPNEQLSVSLERAYNSQSSAKTAFGIGWTYSFDMELLNICKGNELNFENMVLKDGSGTLFFYTLGSDGNYISSMGKYTELKKEELNEEVSLPESTVGVTNKTRTVTLSSIFTMKTKDNVEYRFNSSGQLVYMAEPNGNFLLFEYEPNKGLLCKVTTSKNLSVELSYYTEDDYMVGRSKPDLLWVKEAKMPDGSKVTYEYAEERLSKVTKTGTDGSSAVSWEMAYTDGILTQLTDALGNPYQISYVDEKVEKVIYPNGDGIKLEYLADSGETKTYRIISKNGTATEVYLETNQFETASGNSILTEDCEENTVNHEYTDNLLAKSTYEIVYHELKDGKVVPKTETKTDMKTYDSEDDLTEESIEDGIRYIYTYPEKTDSALDHLPIRIQEVDSENYLIRDDEYKYDSFGNVIEIEDNLDNIVTTIEYYTEDTADGHIKGEIKSMKDSMGESTADDVTTDYSYTYQADGTKKMVQTETSKDYRFETTVVYDVMGREISQERRIGTERELDVSTAVLYDALGRISKITETHGTIEDVVTRSYNANGAMIGEVASDGTIYTYAYDNMNRVISSTIQKDGLTKSWTTEYTYGSVDVHVGSGTKHYDHVQIVTEKNPDGEILSTTYTDMIGNVIRQKANGLYVDYSYDVKGKVITKSTLGTNPENVNPLVTLYLYDKDGNMTNQILNPSYDTEAGCFVVTDESITSSMTYDTQGNMLSKTDAEGYTTSYTYDNAGRVTKTTFPSGSSTNSTSVQYDVENSDGTTSDIITDALGRTSVTTYNSAKQMIEIADKGNGSVTPIKTNYTYDAKGLLTKETGSLGTAITYEYDNKDRVTTVHYLNASGSEELRTCYTYDKSDNVTAMRDYKVSGSIATLYRYTGYTYDRLQRMVGFTEISTSTEPTEAAIAAHTTEYEYDIDGNLIAVTYPTSLEWNVTGMKYTYDANQWLQEVAVVTAEGTEAKLRAYTYTEYGEVATIKDYRVLSETGEVTENPNYTTCTYTYDTYGRPTSMVYTESTAPEAVREAYTYEYDKNSRITKETLSNLYSADTSD